ncbi:hypothetical protein [Streptomyces sp. or20]|uniref:hypothetical protein n=1 Tax=Streptomyces sp. or20 TaxID=1828016 RepID=UPI000BF01FB9|nr:hypothetical protein [Streptomyces sp. or20]
MSAWAELVNADGSDEWLELCSRALVEVREEALRRAVRKQLAEVQAAESRGLALSPRYVVGILNPEETR